MAGTELYLCDAERGQQLLAGAVSLTCRARVCSNAGLRWKRVFSIKYPKVYIADSNDTLKHFLTQKEKCKSNNIGTIMLRTLFILPALVSPEGCLPFPKGA